MLSIVWSKNRIHRPAFCHVRRRFLCPLVTNPHLVRSQSSSSSYSNTVNGFRRERCRRLFSSVSEDESAYLSLSKLLSQNATNLSISRNKAERLIKEGYVTLRGVVVKNPRINLLDYEDIISNNNNNNVTLKVQGKPVLFDTTTSTSNKETTKGSTIKPSSSSVPRVWAVNKLAGEVVSEQDPQGRRSLLDRLVRGGVGKRNRDHLKPIGRLDIPTEGLILVTNDGNYARQMELPSNRMHRVYRARVHGRLNSYKLDRIRRGFDGYKPMKIAVERRHKGNQSSSNSWVQITATEGQNRQIRNVFQSLGVTVTRLIRIAYGDYELQSIPPGLAIQVPWKPVERQKAKGKLFSKASHQKRQTRRKKTDAAPITWVQGFQS